MFNSSTHAFVTSFFTCSTTRTQLAESDLLWLKDRAPDEFNVHLYLGRLYKLVGRKTDMLHHFALAQDLEPRLARWVTTRARLGIDVLDS